MTTARIIEHTLRRPGGTKVPMPPTALNRSGVEYHFKPSATDERHLAVVADPAHLARFLVIVEAYQDAGAAPSTEARGATQGTGGAAGSVPQNPQPITQAPPAAVSAPVPELVPFTLPDGSTIGVTLAQHEFLTRLAADAVQPAATAEPTDDAEAEQPVEQTAPVVLEEPKADEPETIEKPAAEFPEEDGLDDLSREELVKLFEAKFTRTPPQNARKAVIIEKLRERE